MKHVIYTKWYEYNYKLGMLNSIVPNSHCPKKEKFSLHAMN